MVGQRMLGDIGEKFFEMGQSLGSQVKKKVVKGMVVSAKKQLTGKKSDGQVKGEDGKGESVKPLKKTEDIEEGMAAGRKQFKQMLGDIKGMTPKQLQQVKQQDLNLAQQKTAKIRQHIQQYQKIQQAIQVYRGKKAQEIPAYIRGKPGEVATPEERVKKTEELKKLEKEEKKKKKPLLPPSVSRLFGSKERGKFVVG